MSKYDKEREAMGITPLASSSSKGKSKYDNERTSYRKADENKQYADQMKSAYLSNPDSFNVPAIKKDMPQPATKKGIPIVDTINNKLGGVVEGISKFGNRAANSAVDMLTLGQSKKYISKNIENSPSFMKDANLEAIRPASSFADHAADFTGSAYGLAAMTPGLYASGGKLAIQGLAKLAPNAPMIAQTLVRGAGAGLVYGTAREGIDAAINPNDKTVGQRLAGVGMDTAMFAGGDAAFGLVGAGLKKIAGTKFGDAVKGFLSKEKPVETAPQTQPVLGLPEPKSVVMAREAQNRSVLPTNESPIYGQGDIHTFELPEGNYVKPTRLKVMGKEDTFNNVIPKIFTQATERMTPPLENETLLTKWVQGHLNDAGHDVSLNEVRSLNYEDLRQLAEEMRTRLNVHDVARKTAHDMGYGKIFDQTSPTLKEQITKDAQSQVYGVPAPKVDIQKPSFNVQHVADAAMPETKVSFNKPAAEIPKTETPKAKSKYAEEREQILKEQQPPEDVEPHAEPRIRDKVTNYLDEAAQAARERLKAKRNTLSSNPIDQYADYAIIGASHIANGVVKFADFSERMIADFGDTVKPHLREIFKKSKDIHKEAESRTAKDMQGLKGVDPTLLKDFSGMKFNSSDVYRNFKDVFGDKYPQMKEAILDPLDSAKHDNVKMQEEWLNKLHSEVVEKLGIEKGSKLSALVQKYGEKQIDLPQLQKLAPKDWEKVVEADKFFRKSYDELIDIVNETRKQIYPHSPEKIIPKRSDYYRHFQDFGSLTGLKNLFDTPAGIDPHLVGLSEFTLPKSKFAGFMQKRGLGPFKNDAVGGFLNYIPSASYATHIDPQIDVFKNLAKNLASETENTKNLNGFIEFLQKYSQDLAGKTNSLDRAFQEYIPGGRKTMSAINWINGRVKSNTILGNAGSAIAQVANIPVGIAFAKQYAVKGVGKTLISAIKGNPLHNESQFLKERFIGKAYRKFDTRWMDPQNPLKLKNAAVWILETADRMGTEFIWNSAYEKALKEGVKNPVKYADDNARRLVAGRGIGEVPLMQKSKLFQTVAPFTLEVANLWRIQKDFIKEKDFAAMALLLVGNYAFNKVAEQVKGSGVTFDPIQAIIEASADDLSPLERGGRIAGEVVSNLPLGSALASLYPEYGTKILPTRKKLFGDNDPTRFGTGLLAAKGLLDPYKIVPSFGGSQLKKTVGAIQDINKGAAMTNGKEKTPIHFTPLKSAQALTFGTNATKDMQTYFNNDRRPLSEEQTAQINALPKGDRQKAYDYLMKQRTIDSLKAQAKKISEDTKLKDTQKQKKIDELIKKYQDLTMSH